MALIQALLAMLGRSAGRILNAIFGWAVRALFGATSGAQQTLLTALVATAALWPILAIGIAAPRVTTWVLTFVPISSSISSGVMRSIWVALALLVPALLGIAIAAKPGPGVAHESRLASAARGYPLTLGIAIAFWITFVVVPILQLRSALRRHEQSYVPLITTRKGYRTTADRVGEILRLHGFDLSSQPPKRWMRAPIAVLRAFGGAAVDPYTPDQLAYFAGPELEVVLHPSSLLLRGTKRSVTTAHGTLVEGLSATDAYQTTSADAQSIERQIRNVWKRLEQNPRAHTNSRRLLGRLDEIAGELAHLDVPYEEWQIVYRQALQLARALRGESQLLAPTEEETMTRPEHFDSSEPRSLSTAELIREIASKAMLLVNKEIDLIRQESKEDLRSELAAIKGFATAAIAGIATLNLLLVAAVFALSAYMSPLSAALCLAGVTLVIAIAAAGIAWGKHVKEPLDLTRESVKEDIQWAKEQAA